MLTTPQTETRVKFILPTTFIPCVSGLASGCLKEFSPNIQLSQ